jgi:hypothetical protein
VKEVSSSKLFILINQIKFRCRHEANGVPKIKKWDDSNCHNINHPSNPWAISWWNTIKTFSIFSSFFFLLQVKQLKIFPQLS